MSYLLDTNTCIRYLNGQSENIKARLERLTPDDVVLCSVVKAELLYGAAKSAVGERTFARLNPSFIVSHRLPLSKAREAYEEFDQRGVGEGAAWTKVLLKPGLDRAAKAA